MPDNFDAARRALTERFPEARAGIDQLLGEMERIAAAMGTLSQGTRRLRNPRQGLGALLKLLPAIGDWQLSLSQKLDRVFGDNEAVKCALAANLSYYHDDPATLWWIFFAMAQGSYLQSGGRFVQGGSQRLSSALGPRHQGRRRRGDGAPHRQRRRGGCARPRRHRHAYRARRQRSQNRGRRAGHQQCRAAALAPLMPAAAAEKLTAATPIERRRFRCLR